MRIYNLVRSIRQMCSQIYTSSMSKNPLKLRNLHVMGPSWDDADNQTHTKMTRDRHTHPNRLNMILTDKSLFKTNSHNSEFTKHSRK